MRVAVSPGRAGPLTLPCVAERLLPSSLQGRGHVHGCGGPGPGAMAARGPCPGVGARPSAQ